MARQPHDLRHTCASLARSAGVNVLTLQRMLGHKSARVTLDRYTDLMARVWRRTSALSRWVDRLPPFS
jgi:integrase